MLYVALLTTSLPQVPIELEDPVGVCYQIHGKSGNYFNLLTHSCTSVNAHWVAVTSSLNIIDQIAVRAVSKSLPPICHTILVNLEGCSVSINDNTPVITNGKLLDNGGVVVKRKDNIVTIKVPNCSDQKLIMRVECENRTVFNSGSEEVVEMIKFNVTRDLNVENGQAHGMIGNMFVLLCHSIVIQFLYLCSTFSYKHTQHSLTHSLTYMLMHMLRSILLPQSSNSALHWTCGQCCCC